MTARHRPAIDARSLGRLVLRRGTAWTLVAGLSGALGCAAGGSEEACTTRGDCFGGKLCVAGTCVPPTDARTGDGTSETDGGDYVPPTDGGDDGDGACGTASFTVTDTQVTFAVPTGVSYMHVKAWGAGGNGEGQCLPKIDGGLGGYSEAVFAVKPGDPLIIIVGKRGRSGMTGEDRVRFGFGDWGGGGLSGVFVGPTLITDKDQAKALVIAGGGGSAGAPGCHPGGTGNHPDSGGMPTMQGGTGADSVNGGAGGYAGGKGGAKGQASSGGSGWVDKSALDSRMLHVERETGAPPKTDDPDYDGAAGKEEASGLVVIKFTCGKPTIK